MKTLMVCGSPEGSSPRLLRRLAADADWIIAVDSGANWLDATGLTPDLLVGDLDSISESALASIKDSKCRLVTVSPHKDFTDFDLALSEFVKAQALKVQATSDTIAKAQASNVQAYSDSTLNDQTELIITNVLGGRIDHELGALGSLAKAPVDLGQTTIVEDDCQAKILVGQSTLPLSKVAAVGSTFSVVPLFAEAEVSVSGVEWELNHAILPALASQGVSNIINQPDAQITIYSGTVFIIGLAS